MVRNVHTPGHLALMQALIEARKGRGLTQAQLATLLVRPQSYVAKIEIGERGVSVVELAEWSNATNIDAGDVMTAVINAIYCS